MCKQYLCTRYENVICFTCENVGSVFGNKYGNIVQTSLYYVNKSVLNQGTQKSLNEFAVSFCDANNEFIESSSDDALSSWNYNASIAYSSLARYNHKVDS